MTEGCTLCPRECGAHREKGETGYCRMPVKPHGARAALHDWEEPCISGTRGSGAVFFSGCTLRCVFCQNHEIAAGIVGKPITNMRLSEIFLELQMQGAHNINLVTAGHFLPSVTAALKRAKELGLQIPVVYNSSGYEKPESLCCLEGLVDVWLPDYKYESSSLAERYSHAPDYPVWAKRAVEEMVRQAGVPVFDAEGMMQRGVIVRHLVLPGCVSDSKDVLEYLQDTWGEKIWVSILRQYTPLPQVRAYPELDRKVTEEEYEEVVDYARFLGMRQVYIQVEDCARESFIPAFDYEGI